MRPLEGQRCLPLPTTLTNNTFPPSGRIASLSGRILSLSFPVALYRLIQVPCSCAGSGLS